MSFRDRRSEIGKGTWAVAVGAGVGLAAGLFLWNRARSARRFAQREAGGLARLEDQVVERLRNDTLVSGRPIEVAALADGIVELSGAVDTDRESKHAAMLAQGTPGVRTVLNRLDVAGEVRRIESARRQPTGPGTARGETHWSGIGVGTGRRRQGRDTDPARRDDKVDMVEESLGTDLAEEQASEPLDKLGPAVEGHSSGPAAPLFYGQVDDTTHRRLGNVPERPHEEMNPDAADHENVKPGTELTLEQEGVEGNLIDRGLKDRS